MWEGLGADGWIVWVCIAEVVVRNRFRINVWLCKQSNLGSESEFIQNSQWKCTPGAGKAIELLRI